VFAKDARTELRTRSGISSAALFSIVSVVAIALAGYGMKLSAMLGSGLLWVVLIFSSIISLPRTFVSEEESGTGDLLRLLARPHAVFWGKALFNLAQMIVTALGLSVLFFVLTSLSISLPGLYLVSLLGGCAALAGAVTLCGALVAQASNRSALVGAIGLPLLLPLVALGIGATRVAMGEGTLKSGFESAFGLWCYAAAIFAAGPHLFAAIWKG
jgi:heme exporter protein B